MLRSLFTPTLTALVLMVAALCVVLGSAAQVGAHSIGPGDVNCSEEIDSIDSSLILQYGAGLVQTLECIDDADVNNDDYINSIDSSLILQYSAGLIDTLG